MEFSEYKCPVCQKQFQSGDDVVVCPECGTPHHRECYERLGKCFFESRHGEEPGSDSAEDAGAEGALVCPNCGHKNEAAALFCNHCGKAFSFDENNADGEPADNNGQQGFGGGSDRTPPFGFGGAFTAFDPLAGMKPEEEIADGVKVSEAAKFVGRTTQYFMMVFKKIRDGIGSRFNFSAAVFAEVYFLYRKMTVLGVIISVFMIATSVLSTAIMMSPDWITNYNNALQLMESGVSLNPFSKQLEFMYLPLALQGIRLVVRIVCGACANRLYYNHCMKQIGKIKADPNTADLNKTLEQKGGVNLPLAACFYAASVIIGYISSYISQTGV